MTPHPYIADRTIFDTAQDLLTQFGGLAAFEADSRARHSRSQGNVPHYCRWRTIERLILVLSKTPEDVTLH